MSAEALANISRKVENLRRIQMEKEQARQRWLARWGSKEEEVLENLENTVALVIDTWSASLTDISELLGCSRDKVKVMADRARKRNREFLRRGTN